MTNFALGRTTITEKAKSILRPQEVLAALWSHSKTDDLEVSNGNGAVYMSAHTSSTGAAFWIRTEPNHELTTVFLPQESDRSDAVPVDAWILSFTCPGCGI